MLVWSSQTAFLNIILTIWLSVAYELHKCSYKQESFPTYILFILPVLTSKFTEFLCIIMI